MNEVPNLPVVIMPVEQLKQMIESCFQPLRAEIQKAKEGRTDSAIRLEYLTSQEFMEATKIRRSKMEHLIKTNQIKSIKKSRKIYIPASEIERYFSDPTIK
jgi:hypothetical protein